MADLDGFAERLILKLGRRDHLSRREADILRGLPATLRRLPADVDIVRAGDRMTQSCLLVDGLTARYKLSAEGRRQITAFHVGGDFVDLHGFLLKQLDHSIGTLTPCRVAFVPHHALLAITETEPHLARLLWFCTLADAAIHRQWLLGLGRLPAVAHLGHLLCETYLRMADVGLAADHRFAFPITQAECGDALGLSAVHANRTVQELRRTGLMSWRRGRVEILDWDGLCELSDFDPTYLNLDNQPR